MNTFFDKIFVVNLDRRVDRMESIQKQANELSITINRFPAFDGSILTTKPGKPPYKGWSTISMGNYGNVLSQRAIIQKALSNDWESVLILEDDASFDTKDKIDEYLEAVPKNWDMIYFGGNHQSPLQRMDMLVGKCTYTLTAHAVGIRNTMYEHILHATRNLNVPIDLSYAELHRTYNAYSSIRNLATQIAGYSDIEERTVDYSAIIK